MKSGDTAGQPRSETWSEPGDAPVEERIPELPTLDERRFEVAGERARGGVGLVFEARDRLLDRRVALKQPQQQDRAANVARFFREALITARLQHPAIVPIYDAGVRASGEPCFAMRLYPGATLRDAIAAAPGLDERLALLPHVQVVADAVAYAHGQGVLHRDLKPGNVLVGPFGETVVIDWGLAKDLRGVTADVDPATLAIEPAGPGASLTHTGAILGTPGYMAPEQARGEDVDERADVYAIGAILYHVLTGQAPYGEDALVAVLAGPPPPVQSREPGAPSDLQAITAKAMAREPAARYPTAEALARDLKRFATGQLVGARRYSRFAIARRWLRRNRATALVGLALVVALFAGVFAVLRENNRLRLMQAQAVVDRDPTAAAAWLKSYRVEANRESRAGDVAARAAAAGVARHVLTLEDDTAMRVCLAAGGDLAGVLGREGGVSIFDLVRGTRRKAGTSKNPNFCSFVGAARSGVYLVAWSRRGDGAVAARLPDGQAVAVPGPPPADSVDAVVGTPDGRLVVTGNDGRIRVVDLERKTARLLENLPPGFLQAVAAEDGAAIYASDKQGGLWKVPLEGGAPTLVDRLGKAIYRMALSGDGRQLAFSTETDVALRDLATGQTWRHRQPELGGFSIQARPALGGAIFIAGEDQEVTWLDARTGEQVTLGRNAFFKKLEVSQDGSRASWIDKAGKVFVVDFPGRRVRTLVGHHTAVRGFDMTPDGRWLATTHGAAVRVFALPAATSRRVELGAPQPLVRAVGPRFEVVATLRKEALVAIDARTGSQRPLVQLGAPVQELAVSPGGRRAAASMPGCRVVVVDLSSARSSELARGTGSCERLVFAGEDRLVGLDSAAAVHLWDLAGGGHRVIARLESAVHGDTFRASRNGDRVLVTSTYKGLLIELPSNRVSRLDPQGGVIFHSALSRDGRKVALGHGDGRVVLWEQAGDGMKPRALARRDGFVSGILFTPDERGLVVVDETGALFRYDGETGAVTELGRHAGRITTAAASPSGRRLATSDSAGEIRLWEPESSSLTVLPSQGEPRRIEFLGEDILVAAGVDGGLHLTKIEKAGFVPTEPVALSRWLDDLTTARIDATGEPVSP